MIESVIKRKKTRKIWVGDVPVGGNSPISVQSMTNTDTDDVASTVKQIHQLQDAGADIVRVSVPTLEAAESFKKIRTQVNIPLVSDIHFDYKIALAVLNNGVDCLRINPGNIGNEKKIKEFIASAKDKNIPIRVGVNAGSLEKDLQMKYGELDGIIFCGIVIRGETSHYDLVTQETFRAIGNLALEFPNIYMVNNVICVENKEQLIERLEKNIL